MLVTGLSNEIGLSLNPIFYLPVMIGTLDFCLGYIILAIAVPIVFGFLGFYTANHAIKHLSGDESEGDESGICELQMAKPKQIVFEV
jgi:hypothetical protein